MVVLNTLGLLKNSDGVGSWKEKGLRILKTLVFTFLNVGWFDGATQENKNLSGAGGVIKISKDTNHKWIFNCDIGTNSRDELLDVWVTLTLAICLGLNQLQVIGYSKIVIEWLNCRGNLNVTSLMGWKDRIRDLIKSFSTLIF
jgi:ribonuclease HI